MAELGVTIWFENILKIWRYMVKYGRMKKSIYLDYASTTPIDPKVLSAMTPFLKGDFANPSSIHGPGQKAREAIDKAREQVAGFLNCAPTEIIFTGSATEADNLAILGVVKATRSKGVMMPHIITVKTEHHAIIEPCEALEKQRLAEVTYLPVDKDGLIKPEAVQKAIKANTVLVSIMYANNEIGVIQPISKIGAILEKFKVQSSKFKVIFHTDAAQAVNYLDCDVQKLGVDLLTLSGHKIYGPKGIGALYIRKGALIEPIIFGGGQERGMRPGTENVAGIVGLGAAIAELETRDIEISKYQNIEISKCRNVNISKLESLEFLRNKLIDGVLTKIPRARLNGSRENRLPNNANFSFEGAEGESIVIALDQEGIAASTGSACSSRSLEPSHVLLALGLSHEQAHGSLRLTLGRYTTEQEIGRVLAVLPKIIERLRKISGRR